jgi:antitoxin VapB
MGLNIRSEEVNRLATELAEKRKITKTEAVRLALVNELGRRGEEKSLRERLGPVLERVGTYQRTGLAADKAFFDEINGDY